MTDLIEPETKRYLKKVMQTVFVGLFWMFANVVFGIFMEFGFVNDKISAQNIIFYAISICTLIFLIRYFIKMWTTDNK